MSEFICTFCRKVYSLNEIRWKCDCGGVLDIVSQAPNIAENVYGSVHSIWRYRTAIPVSADRNIVTSGEGFTPLLKVALDRRPVWIKQDQLSPSGSFKDRGAAVLISKAKELGIGEVVLDSSGNAAAAMACYCAQANIKCRVFVPESTSPGKLIQIRSYGATVNSIPGSREESARAVLKAAESSYYASHYWNPFFFQGTKTIAYEVCEQMNWKVPDVAVVPVGNGSLLIGLYIGFAELKKQNITEKMPRLIGVQALECGPIYRAFKEKKPVTPVRGKGGILAEGIAIADPLRGAQILAIVKKTGGAVIGVNNQEIQSAWREMAKMGFYIESTSAVGIAGLKKIPDKLAEQNSALTVLTGHGLKTNPEISISIANRQAE